MRMRRSRVRGHRRRIDPAAQQHGGSIAQCPAHRPAHQLVKPFSYLARCQASRLEQRLRPPVPADPGARLGPLQVGRHPQPEDSTMDRATRLALLPVEDRFDYLDVRLEPDARDRLELFRLADEQQTTGHLVVVQRFGADVVTRRPHASAIGDDRGEYAAQPVERLGSARADRLEHDERGRGALLLLAHIIQRADHDGRPPAILADRALVRQPLVRGEAEDEAAGPGEMGS